MRPSILIDQKRYYLLDDFSEFQEGKGRHYEIDRVQIAAMLWQGDIYAFDARCPHEGGALYEGCLQNGKIVCPRHGWTFDLTTGKRDMNPLIQIACYKTIIQDGMVFVCIEKNKEI